MSSVDRISELPEVILHHILSYLPIKDAARTSVLSKWLNNAWQTLPYLNFKDMSRNFDDWEQVGKNNDLLMAVRRIVKRREQQNVSIEKFSLFLLPWRDEHMQMHHHLYCDIRLNSIIYCVATEFLKELELINGITGCWNLLLPQNLFSAKWLTVLALIGFDLSSSWSSVDIKFTCLQKLILEQVFINDSILENLISESHSSLEILELVICKGLKTIRLNGGEFVKLKRLKVSLEINSSVEVLEVHNAPEFEDLQVVGYMHSNCYFNVKNCPLLRKVFLQGDFITENNLHQLLASSDVLQELSIGSCSLLNNVHISSDSIKKLSIFYLRNIKKLHIFSPNLESLSFELPDETPDFSLNGSSVGSVGVNLIIYKLDYRCFKFLQHFKHIRKITLNCQHIEIIQDYMRDKLELLSPLYGTRDISFKQGIINHSITELVEYLLWLAPRAERISIVSFMSTTLLSLELVYNEDENDEQKKNLYCCHCKFLPINCWRHCLKEVRIHKFEEKSENNLLTTMKYFFSKEFVNLKIVCGDNISYSQ